MKQITNKEYEERQKYKAEKAKGRVLLRCDNKDKELAFTA